MLLDMQVKGIVDKKNYQMCSLPELSVGDSTILLNDLINSF